MDNKTALYKLKSIEDGMWASVSYPRVFMREGTTGPDRLRIGVPALTLEPILALLELMPEPFILLYVLHTPRGAEPGRYQSPEFTHEQVLACFAEFGEFFMRDSRHDIWIHSFPADNTLVWDRHNVLYAYDLLDAFSSKLKSIGYGNGDINIPFPHTHYYHKEFDGQQETLLEKYDWYRTELMPADIQEREKRTSLQ